MLWPDKREGPWTLRLTVGIINDRPGVIGVELWAVDPSADRKTLRDWAPIYKPGRRRWKSNDELSEVADREPLSEIVGYEPITTSGIRLPLAEMTAAYLSTIERSDRIRSQSAHFPPELRESSAERLQSLERLQAAEARRGPGRPAAYSTEHYERVAAIYQRALRENRPPTLAVAEEMAGGSKSAAGKWIAKCRELALLPPTVKGKAAGWPVAKEARRSLNGKS